MLVTGVSGAPLSAVVRKVASSAGAALASNATAGSVSETRFSLNPFATGISWAHTHNALQSSTRLTAIVFIHSSPCASHLLMRTTRGIQPQQSRNCLCFCAFLQLLFFMLLCGVTRGSSHTSTGRLFDPLW